jgi:hypothetical protein
MQRSAAKSVASSPSTPNGPPSKKVRLSNGADHEILQMALAEEEKKRQEALDKAAQYTGETKWVLSVNDPLAGKRRASMNVRQAGFAELDAEDESEEEEEEARPIRMQFGGGVKKKADVRSSPMQEWIARADRLQNSVPFVNADESEEGETDSSSEEGDSDDPTAALIRETKRDMAAEKRQARANAGNDTPKRTPKPLDEDMYVGGLTSLSGGGGKPSGRDMSSMECFSCGRKGHARANCPNGSTPRGSSGRGRGRGRR